MTRTEKLVSTLMQAGFELVGSRLTGQAKEHSDWDFAVQDSVGARDLIGVLGFLDVTKAVPKLDMNTIAVYQLLTGATKVQIAVVKNIEMKMRITLALKYCRPLREWERKLRLSKKDRTNVWNAFYRMAGMKDE